MEEARAEEEYLWDITIRRRHPRIQYSDTTVASDVSIDEAIDLAFQSIEDPDVLCVWVSSEPTFQRDECERCAAFILQGKLKRGRRGCKQECGYHPRRLMGRLSCELMIL